MQALIIDNKAMKALERLQMHAMANIITKEIRENFVVDDHIADAFCCNIDFGYRVCLTIEDQPDGRFRALCMSLAGEGRFPPPQYVQLIMSLLGFKAKSLDDPDLEVVANKEDEFISVIEKY